MRFTRLLIVSFALAATACGEPKQPEPAALTAVLKDLQMRKIIGGVVAVDSVFATEKRDSVLLGSGALQSLRASGYVIGTSMGPVKCAGDPDRVPGEENSKVGFAVVKQTSVTLVIRIDVTASDPAPRDSSPRLTKDRWCTYSGGFDYTLVKNDGAWRVVSFKSTWIS